MPKYVYPDTTTIEGKFKDELDHVRSSISWLAMAIKGADAELRTIRDPDEIREALSNIISDSQMREKKFWNSRTQTPK
jgi:hypothetical protein